MSHPVRMDRAAAAARASQHEPAVASPRRPYRYLRGAIAALAICAVAASAVLFGVDGFPALAMRIGHAPASAAPLILIGTAYLLMSALVRVSPLDLLKRVLLAAAFILWGVDQLMTPGPLARLIGDVVITLYVSDLALMIRDHLRGVGPPTP
ncbi:MAG: hypothetical protein IVW56_08745 [Candidatus Binataceae bacterium]|nr:hypothetical protein [Candidatus Binataceae bacterium]